MIDESLAGQAAGLEDASFDLRVNYQAPAKGRQTQAHSQ